MDKKMDSGVITPKDPSKLYTIEEMNYKIELNLQQLVAILDNLMRESVSFIADFYRLLHYKVIS